MGPSGVDIIDCSSCRSMTPFAVAGDIYRAACCGASPCCSDPAQTKPAVNHCCNTGEHVEWPCVSVWPEQGS